MVIMRFNSETKKFAMIKSYQEKILLELQLVFKNYCCDNFLGQ